MIRYFGQQTSVACVLSASSILLALLVRFVLAKRAGDRIARNSSWIVLLLGTIGLIGIYTVAPIGIRHHITRSITLVPFTGGEFANLNQSLIIGKILFNIALFAPFGFCLRMGFYKRVSVCAFAGFVTSLVVESTQYLWSVGTSTVTDLLMNTFGALIGALAAATLSKFLRKRGRAKPS